MFTDRKVYIILWLLLHDSKMDQTKNLYREATRDKHTPLNKIDNIKILLPEWIVNLKEYFEKKPDGEYSSSSR